MIGWALFLLVGLRTIWYWSFIIFGLTLIIRSHFAYRWVEKVGIAAGTLHAELRMFALPGILVVLGAAAATREYGTLFWELWVAATWWISRNWPEDDRWKRRGRKVLEKVSAIGGKLVVTPA